jgi:hypothetical protein
MFEETRDLGSVDRHTRIDQADSRRGDADDLGGAEATRPQLTHARVPRRLTELLAQIVMDERMMQKNRSISPSQHPREQNLASSGRHQVCASYHQCDVLP